MLQAFESTKNSLPPPYSCTHLMVKLVRASQLIINIHIVHTLIILIYYGAPSCIEQKEPKGKAENEQATITINVAHLKCDTQVKRLLALLYYYLKPVYIIANTAPTN